jgi:hypothetical protein
MTVLVSNPLQKRSLIMRTIAAFLIGIVVVAIAVLLSPEIATAAPVGIGGGSFEAKMGSLQDKFINVLLPIASIFGIVIAGILAATGNEAAKGKVGVILFGSILGFLAPHLIGWIKGILG